jgi:hypothetical protein
MGDNQMMTANVMKYKGFQAQVMEAERLVGDRVFGLPPGNALSVYPSQIFKEYPEKWMCGPGVFVIPVRPNKGLWFNFTMNDHANTAVLMTVKGCNPITGMQTSGYHLERYDTKCPKHGKEFGPDRFCSECGYKWPPQGYLCHPSIMWWDGWRDSGDGSVRQFFFTEDEVRDIATHMIGKENTVPAFGFAFYRPKVERPRATQENAMYNFLYVPYQKPFGPLYEKKYTYSSSTAACNPTWTYTNCSTGETKGLVTLTSSVNAFFAVQQDGIRVGCDSSAVSAGTLGEHSFNDSSLITDMAAAAPATSIRKRNVVSSFSKETPTSAHNARVEESLPKKEVAVGAGAKIRQDLAEDPYPLDTWKDAPDSVMTIYFVFKEEVDRMLSKGVIETTEKPEGMLEGLPVG